MSEPAFTRFTGYLDLNDRKHEIVVARFDMSRISRGGTRASTLVAEMQAVAGPISEPARP